MIISTSDKYNTMSSAYKDILYSMPLICLIVVSDLILQESGPIDPFTVYEQ